MYNIASRLGLVKGVFKFFEKKFKEGRGGALQAYSTCIFPIIDLCM